MTPNAEEYTAWELWTQCDHTIAISIMHSRQLDDIKIVVIGAQSIKHSLGAAEELYTKLTDSSDEPYEANTVSVAVSGQGSIPRLIDVLLTRRVFLPSGTNRVLYRDPFRGREIFVEFVPTPELLYLPASATRVADLGNTAYSIPCSSLLDALIDYFWRSSDWSATTESDDFPYRLAEEISSSPNNITLKLATEFEMVEKEIRFQLLASDMG
ncbi:ubiquitin C-terminal hydrolase [Aspergillus luchuensis]|uniref:Ubiquitin C-terminal hydrolase n=1 Tax=Aspergillus kawachii TaxID=1069201 RepID=A0A146EZZ5_ASPKA|nr:ubiquitin C-terminal hydrolase [Aspergillus luchuensis]